MTYDKLTRRFTSYLGDGAYVYLDEFDCVVLYTSNGVAETNRIVLEDYVLESLENWLLDLKERGEAGEAHLREM